MGHPDVANWMKRLIYAFALLAFTVVLAITPIIVFEIFLNHTTVFDQLDSPNPAYTPRYLRKVNRQIKKNGFKTTDRFRTWRPDVKSLRDSLINDEGCKIVVLGDNFVAGDGVAVQDTWGAKLEQKS